MEKLKHRILKSKDAAGNIASLVVVALILAGSFVLGNTIGNQLILPELFTEKSEETSSETPLEIKPPGPDSTEQEKIDFAKSVRSAGKETDEVDITDCNISPRVARTTQGIELTIVNRGSKEQKFFVHKNQLTVPPQKSVKLSTSDLMGIYGMRCESPSTEGFLEIVAK